MKQTDGHDPFTPATHADVARGSDARREFSRVGAGSGAVVMKRSAAAFD
jgi:hypothetical protein